MAGELVPVAGHVHGRCVRGNGGFVRQIAPAVGFDHDRLGGVARPVRSCGRNRNRYIIVSITMCRVSKSVSTAGIRIISGEYRHIRISAGVSFKTDIFGYKPLIWKTAFRKKMF